MSQITRIRAAFDAVETGEVVTQDLAHFLLSLPDHAQKYPRHNPRRRTPVRRPSANPLGDRASHTRTI